MIIDGTYTESQIEIYKMVERLDEVARSYEAKWGIGNLQEWAPKELQEKFARQQEKLFAAQESQDVNLARHLVEGTIKGWKAIEASAIAQGRCPSEATYMEVSGPDTGVKMKIYKTHTEARTNQEKGCVCFSLQEIARIIEKDYKALWGIKETFPGAEITAVKGKVNFQEGDEIPF